MKHFASLSFVLVGLISCDAADRGFDRDFPSRADALIGQTQTACDFIPSVTAVAALLTGGASTPVATIANGICAEVNKLPRLESDEGPQNVTVEVDGISVEGLLL